ncbi:MAG TPA: hypothetical protein VKZ63_00025 [Kofleriaceae bacterium]|nr:hypothetical protein [Kofleriaceae bacterium]
MSAGRRLRVATCRPLPEPDRDEAPLMAALAAAGVAAELVPWHEGAAWQGDAPVLLRSTWDYALRLDAFLAWSERIAAQAPLLNPVDIVRRNAHKRYLVELAERGVPAVPTLLLEAGAAPPEAAELRERIAGLAGDGVVVKPAVGAGSRETRRFGPGQVDSAAAAALALLAREDVLVQPFLPAVDGRGERSLVWIDGEITHAIRKSPRWADGVEQVTGPVEIAPAERELAAAALAPFADRALYGRVDTVLGSGGEPVVMELELIEPSLFFDLGAGSLDRLVAGLDRRLRAAGAW